MTGLCYYGGIDDIDYFRPGDIVPDNTRPVVHCSQLLVNGKEEQLVPGSRLRHSNNNLTFYFTTNDFTRPDLIYFRYRLREKDRWSFLRGANTLSLNGLPHGRYRFEIQASNNSHTWGDSAVIAFAISTPWWQSLWLFIGAAPL